MDFRGFETLESVSGRVRPLCNTALVLWAMEHGLWSTLRSSDWCVRPLHRITTRKNGSLSVDCFFVMLKDYHGPYYLREPFECFAQSRFMIQLLV